jgi:hypothetical protein
MTERFESDHFGIEKPLVAPEPVMAGPEGPPGRPEAWRCRKCGASVPNKLATCPKCGAGR